jgi:large subunit ribosomal protein L14
MIGIGSYVKVLDTCGAHVVQIFRVLNTKYQIGKIGKYIVVAVKFVTPNKKVKKHDVKKGVLVQTKKSIYRKYIGTILNFSLNSMIIFGRNENPAGSRLRGPVSQELRFKSLTKILVLASTVL